MRRHLPWLDDVRRLLAETAGQQPGKIKLSISYVESGDSLEMTLAPLSEGNQPALPDQARLRSIHHDLISLLRHEPQSAKQLIRLSGYQSTSYVRAALADLVRWGLVVHSPDGYALPNQ